MAQHPAQAMLGIPRNREGDGHYLPSKIKSPETPVSPTCSERNGIPDLTIPGDRKGLPAKTSDTRSVAWSYGEMYLMLRVKGITRVNWEKCVMIKKT